MAAAQPASSAASPAIASRSLAGRASVGAERRGVAMTRRGALLRGRCGRSPPEPFPSSLPPPPPPPPVPRRRFGCSLRRGRSGRSRVRSGLRERLLVVWRGAARRAAASASAEGRSAGSSERALSTSESSCFGRSGRWPPSGSAPMRMPRAVSSSEPFQNGCWPASASQSRTPIAQMSAGGPPLWPRSRSGEMYASVPGTSPWAVSVSSSATSARPKSSSFAWMPPWPSASMMFDGLTSRWTMPEPWACARASRIWAAASMASPSRSWPLRIASRSVPPAMYS